MPDAVRHTEGMPALGSPKHLSGPIQGPAPSRDLALQPRGRLRPSVLLGRHLVSLFRASILADNLG